MNESDQIQSDSPIKHDEFRVGPEGGVLGSCWTDKTEEGYSVQASVTSYYYERGCKKKMNHVPNVVVTDDSGAIVSEPHVHDSTNAEKAIENARKTVKAVFGRLEE